MLEALFVAVAKAAPSATVAASGGDDWKWLVPVATLILGFGLKWLQDHLTEKSRRRFEKTLRREQRYDAMRMRRLDAERANLLELQKLSQRFMLSAGKRWEERSRPHYGSDQLGESSPESDAEVNALALEIVPVFSRIHSHEVAEKVVGLMAIVVKADEAPNRTDATKLWDEATQANRELHRTMGRVIRQLEDENQALNDPPVR
ncbi:hypothetical protein [Stenotrophomonas maltophilia]|uniref:hypothetical protein n=1 Tax=Stenotrophomonas maltophilia TaxID=40324 RepID=UPI0013D8E9CB|nr:hypothetical protein [Stenotrophomonas maltophilia]